MKYLLAFLGFALLTGSALAETTKAGFFAGASQEELIQGVLCITQKNEKAFEALLQKGSIFWLKEGVQVSVLPGPNERIIRIRLNESEPEAWTFREAVQ